MLNWAERSSTAEIEKARENGGICCKTRGRARPHPSANRAGLLGGGGAGPLRVARLPGALGKAPGPVLRGPFAGARPQNKAEFLSGVQPAVPHADQSWSADFELSGSTDQAAERWHFAASSRERTGAGERRRAAFP